MVKDRACCSPWQIRPHMLPSSMRREIYWLTIYIWFAPVFCKSQKWVAVATAMCYLACWEGRGGERERERTSKYLLKHKYNMNFYCSLHPKWTNLLTEVLFFHNLKNGLAFCCLQFYYIYYPRDPSLIPGSGRSAGEGKGYPLQCSGLENAMDCIVHGVTELDRTERLLLS